jgi:hypothetical protein
MTRARKEVALLEAIHPDQIYPTSLSPAIFSLGWQACRNRIKSGDLPRPSPIHEGSNREGWFGSQILEHREKMRKIAEERAAIDAARPKQQQPAAFKRKTKKMKLRRGSAND